MTRAIKRRFTIGLDFGSNAARAVVADVDAATLLARASCNYPSGELGIFTSPTNAHLARQHPRDHLFALEEAVAQALALASDRDAQFTATDVVAIGCDTTGSTPIPLDRDGSPLAFDARFSGNLNALAWLWKDHTAHQEAERITAEAPGPWLARIGGRYSSEWYWAKIWHCNVVDPAVGEAAADWIELADWIPAILTGRSRRPIRGVCAAGHKALYAPDLGGFPPKPLFDRWHSALARQRDVLESSDFQTSDQPAGHLSAEWQRRLGLADHVVIATGAFDAHLGAIGSGIRDGTLVKVIGTSTCDVTIAPLTPRPSIPGVCGVVDGSVMAGAVGIEAGQSAVGDLLAWWLGVACADHASMADEAAALRPGESGLIALDWNNGNRTVLVDQRLSGLLLGQTLRTRASDIYRALIEATAFGARMIIERIESRGVPIDRVVACGGIAEKNALFMQIYADVLGRPVDIAGSSETCALGSAIAAAVASKAHADVPTAQRSMVPPPSRRFAPAPDAAAVYDQLFALYRTLHDAFGNVAVRDIGDVMKALLGIAERHRRKGTT